MFIRFETGQKHEESGYNVGIFTLAYQLSREQDLEFYQRKHIEDLLDYFEKELPVPKCFNQNNAISWLKADATEMVSKFWELKTILEEYGQPINVIKQNFVGKVLYSDKYQVVAV